MAAQVMDVQKGAQIWKEHSSAFEESVRFLEAHGLPNGLLPLDDIEEMGYVQETGYFWVKQKTSKKHYFSGMNNYVSYAKEVSGYLDGNSLKKLSGVKAKQLLLWVSIVEISQKESNPGYLFFKTPAGIGKWLRAEIFLLQN
eukprot:c9513_g1_i1 orf=675-1100(-)